MTALERQLVSKDASAEAKHHKSGEDNKALKEILEESRAARGRSQHQAEHGHGNMFAEKIVDAHVSKAQMQFDDGKLSAILFNGKSIYDWSVREAQGGPEHVGDGSEWAARPSK